MIADPQSPPQKRPRRFWFLLVDHKNGQPYRGTNVSSVSLEPTNLIVDFRDAVKVKNANKLSSIDAAYLDVYKNKAAFEARSADSRKEVPLEGFLPLSDELGSRGQDPLFVAVPFMPPPVVVNVQSASSCDIEFYNKISEAEERDGFIHFQTDIPMLDLITNRLYVRQSYETIAETILKGVQKRTIVTGTPGIGKSFFLVYLLWRLVRERKRVFFLYDLDYIYYDGQGKIFNLNGTPLKSEPNFWSMDLWCLFDAKGKFEQNLTRIPSGLCKTIVSTSPRRELLNDFQKASSITSIYMPIWSEQELETVSCMYPKDVNWNERFTYLGGIPRLVLEKTDMGPTAILAQACQSCSLDSCLSAVGPVSTISDESNVIHYLLHLYSTDPYTEPSVVFASKRALDLLVRAKYSFLKNNANALLTACEGNPLASTLCGHFFERHAIEMLGNGGTFKCRPLHPRKGDTSVSATTLHIPRSTVEIVDMVLEANKI